MKGVEEAKRKRGLKWALKAQIPHRRVAGDQLGGGKAGGLCVEGCFSGHLVALLWHGSFYPFK